MENHSPRITNSPFWLLQLTLFTPCVGNQRPLLPSSGEFEFDSLTHIKWPPWVKNLEVISHVPKRHKVRLPGGYIFFHLTCYPRLLYWHDTVWQRWAINIFRALRDIRYSFIGPTNQTRVWKKVSFPPEIDRLRHETAESSHSSLRKRVCKKFPRSWPHSYHHVSKILPSHIFFLPSEFPQASLISLMFFRTTRYLDHPLGFNKGLPLVIADEPFFHSQWSVVIIIIIH